jgi:hypothetical protein
MKKKVEVLTSSIVTVRPIGSGWWKYFDKEQTPQAFSEFANTPRFTVGQLPVSYRVINHWEKAGILPDGMVGDGSWRKFSYIEVVWIMVATHLREFGLSLEKIADIKKQILQYHKGYKAYIYFEFYTALAMGKEDPYIVVHTDGKADIGTLEEIRLNQHGSQSKNMLLISLKGVLEKVGMKVEPPDVLLGLRRDDKSR